MRLVGNKASSNLRQVEEVELASVCASPSNKKELKPGGNEDFFNLREGSRLGRGIIRLDPGSKISQGTLPLFALYPCPKCLYDDSWLHNPLK